MSKITDNLSNSADNPAPRVLLAAEGLKKSYVAGRRRLEILRGVDLTVAEGESLAITGMSDLLKYSLIVVATAPILCIYPFVQKYFVQGVMIGSLKG